MITPETRRRDFPALEAMTYLNTAAESIPPPCVHEALETYWRDKLRGMKGRDQHFRQLEECREVAARMVALAPAEVSFCSCTSEAYNLLASALNLQPGDEVIINDLDYPAGVTPWLRAVAGPTIKVWPSQNGALAVEDLQPFLTEKTRLVPVSLVSFYNGFRLRWKPFLQTVRSLAPQAAISVDVTQALGRVVLDCEGADCLISSTHKWALGTHGGCVVGIPQAQAGQFTTRAGGWFHLANAFAADRFERAVPKQGAASFSVGMPNFAAIYALNASLRYLERIGVANIARHADPLVERLHRGLIELGQTPMAPFDPSHAAGIVAFRHPRSEAIHRSLEQENIHVMHHAGRLRMAVHGYNTASDVERFLEVLGKILAAG